MRDIEAEPYSAAEMKAAEYLCEMGLGGGDDPVGSLVASHRALAERNRVLLECVRGTLKDRERVLGLLNESDLAYLI